LTGVHGTVITIENGYVIFKSDIPNFTDNLKVESSHVSKYFEAGD
jgi:hypothetical protein